MYRLAIVYINSFCKKRYLPHPKSPSFYIMAPLLPIL